MVVRMRATKSHTKNRRSHHALVGAALVKCKNCDSFKKNHIVCKNCGFYNDMKVIDLVKKAEKKQVKNKKKQEEIKKGK